MHTALHLLVASLGAGLLLAGTKSTPPSNTNTWTVSLNGTELYHSSDYFSCPSVEVPVSSFSLNDSLLFEEHLCGTHAAGITTELEVVKQVEYGAKYRRVLSHENTEWSAQCPIPLAAFAEHIPAADQGKAVFNVYVTHKGPWEQQEKPALFQLVFIQE